MPTVEGVCPIIATPFTEAGEIDYDSLRREVRILAEGGCHAATLFGIASEFYKLSDAERDRMVEVVTDAADEHGLTLVVSVTHEATPVAVDWAERYADAGADCLMVFPPTFRGPSQEGVLDHLRAIGEAVDVPVMVQHTQQNVGVAPEQFAALNADVPNVRYFKIETNTAGQYIGDLLEAAEGEVYPLVGAAGTQMVEAYDRGAVGVMPAAGVFEVYLAVHDAYHAGDRERALDAHGDVLALQNQVSQAGIQSEKWLLAERGIVETAHCREPTPPKMDAEHVDLLRTQLERVEGYLDDYSSGTS
ncbi:MAG: dihydrodipicolinate synthase family protein [Halobacteriaceae archaeon]